MKRTLRNVWSPERSNRRDVHVYLPASYSAGRDRYPVVYMQDGQNLSDPETAFAGTWELDTTLARLAERGIEAIVVGVDHAGDERLIEYSPYPDRRQGGGEADAYLEFLASTLKPRIDRLFRTRADRESTAIFGSSMGGLVSLYAYFRYPSIFGRAGAMSPSIWFGLSAVLDFIQEARTLGGRIYLDVGTSEGAGTLRDARKLGRLLVRKGFRRRRARSASLSANRWSASLSLRQPSGQAGERDKDSSLRYFEDRGGRHSEADWARRLEPALEFLLHS